MGITIGIDLGTTNSAACVKKVSISTILNAEGEALTPSCVTAAPTTRNLSENTDFHFVVGRHSRDLIKQYPEQTVTSVKRLMGREFEDIEVQNLINDQRIIYPITTEASEPGSIRIPLGGKMQTPEMISGMILRKLIDDGEAELQGKITEVVVTVPAYFSDRQKFATRAACDYAGIKLLRLLPEPTAAALSFGLEELGETNSKTIMVFDLGGGTFDVSILSLSGGSFMEITKGGDMWLGGDNIDGLLIDHVFACVEKETNCQPIRTLVEVLSPADKARFLAEIKEKAEAAKITLSVEPSATIEMFGILKDEKNKLIDIDVTIERVEFDKLLQPVVQKISEVTRQILHEIRFEPELIDTVLMVGGTSLVLAIQEALKKLFGREKVIVHPRPMLAVAEGAALMAAKMVSQETAENASSFAMMHSTAHDYYLQLADGKRHLLVPRNTPLPVTVEEKLQFAHSKQFLARLRVLNEVEGVLETVGELWFHKDTLLDFKRKNGSSGLMLRFSVDEDNIITLKVWSLQNEEQGVEVHIARGGLAAKLYYDLEQTLSSIVANTSRESVAQDAQRLSCSIVSTILSASDPITGETRIEQKQKAQRQINTLKQCQQKSLAPVAQYCFTSMALKEGENILSSEDKDHLKNILGEFEVAFENLEDVEIFLQLSKKLDEFYRDFPTLVDLTHAENAAEVIEVYEPSYAKKIRYHAKKLSDLYKNGCEDEMVDVKNRLYELIHSHLSWSDNATGRFDREVCL